MPEEPTGAALLLRSEQPRAVCDPAAVRPPHSWDASWQMRLLCLTQLGGGLGGIIFFFLTSFFRLPSTMEGGGADAEERRNFAKNPREPKNTEGEGEAEQREGMRRGGGPG